MQLLGDALYRKKVGEWACGGRLGRVDFSKRNFYLFLLLRNVRIRLSFFLIYHYCVFSKHNICFFMLCVYIELFGCIYLILNSWILKSTRRNARSLVKKGFVSAQSLLFIKMSEEIISVNWLIRLSRRSLSSKAYFKFFFLLKVNF